MTINSINSKSPKVTIGVPVRNGARTIQRTLDSLLSQDYPNYEIIVSDNCSDDDTANIVSQYASNGVKYFFNPVLEKWGESNWNHILTLAKGPLIALYHADDIYTPTMVGR
jgi:glycosyltransferase involved in cell wall biosynthesis